MRRTVVISLIVLLAFSFVACATTDESKQEYFSETLYTSEYLNDELYIFEKATNIVRGKLISVCDFEHLKVYEFSVENDYTGNTLDKIIHVYDKYDERYVIGKEYNLFLIEKNLVLYPHKVYTSVVKETVFDATEKVITYGYANNEYVLASSEIETIVFNQKQNVDLSTASHATDEIKRSETFSEALDLADVVAEIKILSEVQENPYVSMYEIKVENILQGGVVNISTTQLLQPGLATNETYYLLLKQSEDGNEYVIFDPVYSATKLDTKSFDAVKNMIESK